MTLKTFIRNVYEMTVSCGLVIGSAIILLNADAIVRFFH